jgi:hypothetical protein
MAYFALDDLMMFQQAHGIRPWPLTAWRWLSGWAWFRAVVPFWGDQPFPYHAMSLLLHVTNALLPDEARQTLGCVGARRRGVASGLFACSRLHFPALLAATSIGELLSLTFLLVALTWLPRAPIASRKPSALPQPDARTTLALAMLAIALAVSAQGERDARAARCPPDRARCEAVTRDGFRCHGAHRTARACSATAARAPHRRRARHAAAVLWSREWPARRPGVLDLVRLQCARERGPASRAGRWTWWTRSPTCTRARGSREVRPAGGGARRSRCSRGSAADRLRARVPPGGGSRCCPCCRFPGRTYLHYLYVPLAGLALASAAAFDAWRVRGEKSAAMRTGRRAWVVAVPAAAGLRRLERCALEHAHGPAHAQCRLAARPRAPKERDRATVHRRRGPLPLRPARERGHLDPRGHFAPRGPRHGPGRGGLGGETLRAARGAGTMAARCAPWCARSTRW